MEVWGGNDATDAGVVMPGVDAWVYCEPHGESSAGGDVHYVSSCASGRITRFLLADVRGHGERVAEIARDLRSIMRRYINFIDQTAVVQAINTEFERLHDDGMMATAIAGTFFLPRRTLTLSNAGHPPALVYDAKRSDWRRLEPRSAERATTETGPVPANIPLGLFTEASWEKTELPARSGDLVLMFTDSLIEIELDGNRQLGVSGLLDIVRGLDPARPNELIRELLAAVRQATGAAAFEDDTSVMLLRINELGTRRTDDLLAPLRYLGDLFRFAFAKLARRPV